MDVVSVVWVAVMAWSLVWGVWGRIKKQREFKQWGAEAVGALVVARTALAASRELIIAQDAKIKELESRK